MNSNEKLGFERLFEAEADYSKIKGSRLHATIGEKPCKYRVYAYICDTKGRIEEDSCGRGETPDEAVEQWVENSLEIGWNRTPVKRIEMMLLDEIHERDL